MRLGLAGRSSDIGFQFGAPYSPTDRSIDTLGAGEYDTLDVQRASGLQNVDQPHDVDLDAQRGIGCRHCADEGRGMHHVRDLVLLDCLQDARHVEHVTGLEIDFIDDIADQTIVLMARKDDGAMAFLDELAAGFGADDAHASGDQYFHLSLSRSLRCPE